MGMLSFVPGTYGQLIWDKNILPPHLWIHFFILVLPADPVRFAARAKSTS